MNGLLRLRKGRTRLVAVLAAILASGTTGTRVHATAGRPLPGWLAFGVLLAIFLACYSSVWTHEYGFLDDYFDIVPGKQEWVMKKRIGEGRPLYAVLYGILTTGGLHVADLRLFRLMGIVGLSLLAFSVFRALVRTGWDRFQSLCLSVILCTTLPSQLFAAWATTSIFPFAALVSGFALLLAERSYKLHCPRRRIFLATGSVLILLLAICTYQTAAMFFWVMAAIILFQPESSPKWIACRLVWYGIIFVASMLLGFLVWKSGLAFFPEVAEAGKYQEAGKSISFDLVGKIEYLFQNLVSIVNFSFLSPYHFFFSPEGAPRPHSYNYAIQDAMIATALLYIIFSGLILYFEGSEKQRLLKCFMALSIIPLSHSPMLVIETDIILYRTQLAPTSLVVVYMFFALQGFIRSWRAFATVCMNTVLMIAVVLSVLLAAYHVRSYIVIPQVEELEVMRFPLDQEDLSEIKNIHVIRPTPGGWESLAPLYRLEFGFPSSPVDWNDFPMILHLLYDADKHRLARNNTIVTDTTQISVTSSVLTGIKFTELPDFPSDSLVVDMRNLAVRLQAYRWIDGAAVPGTPVIRSVFDVYLGENNLYYVKDSCTLEDTLDNFLLHVTPADPEDLPGHRKQYGFDNLDFGFEWHGVVYDGQCMAIVRRPDYIDARIVTGQYTESGKNLWKGEFRIRNSRDRMTIFPVW